MIGTVDLDTGEILNGDIPQLPHSVEFDVDAPDTSGEQAIAVYLAATDLRKRMTVEIDELIKQSKVVAEEGLRVLDRDRIMTEFGSVYLSGGQSRVSYDTKSLERLYDRDPQLAELLEPCRRETTTKQHVRFAGRGK